MNLSLPITSKCRLYYENFITTQILIRSDFSLRICNDATIQGDAPVEAAKSDAIETDAADDMQSIKSGKAAGGAGPEAAP